MEQYLAPAMEVWTAMEAVWTESPGLCHFTVTAAVGCNGPLPGLSGGTVGPTKPISLGLANFQQARPEKEANLPLSPSLEAWLTCQAQTLEGKDRHGRVIKPPLGQKTYPKQPSLKAESFEPSNAPSLLRVSQLLPEWHRLVPDQGRISPETVSFTRAEFGELQSSVSKILAVLSDLDWWVAGVSNLAKDIQPHLSHDENLQLAGTYSQRYLLESCRSLEELEIQVTALFSHIKLRERDGYLSRLNPRVPTATRKDLRVSPLVGEYIFDEELVSQAGNRLLKSNTIMLDTLAKKSQDHRVRAPPPQPKRPVPAFNLLWSLIRNQNKALTPRAEVGVNSKAKAISPGNPPIGEKAVEQKGRNVPDIWTPACMKAPEVPPLHVRASDQSPERIAGRLSKFSGAWFEIGADPWVMGQETTYPKGSLKWPSLNQSVQELRNKGAIEPAPLSLGFSSRLFLVRKATGEWRLIIDLSSLNVFVHCPSFTMDTPRSILRALQQWLTSLDLKDGYFHIGIDPADRSYLRFCHNSTAWQFTVLPFGLSTSPRVFTKILKPVLAFAHLHRVKLHMYLDDWLLNPGTHQQAVEQTSWLKSLCQKLGLVLNLEKSDLIPSQVATYLGIELETSVGLARPSHKRLTNWLSVAEGFTAQQSPPAVQWLQVLGHLVSLEKLVPYGRIRIRPIQWQLRLQWSQSKEKSSKLIPLDLQSRLAILWWTSREIYEGESQ